MADESPLDRFKTALTGAARAIGHDAEAEVAWTADAPAMQGKSLRVPMPGRTLPRDQAREARGFADSFALRLRHHDEALHRRGMPPSPSARVLRRDRARALRGARREQLCRDARQPRVGDRAAHGHRPDRARGERRRGADAHRARAAAARAADRPAGPAAAREGVELVREFVESRIGDDFERLALTLDDQKAFQSLAVDMLRHLELVEAEPIDESGDDDGDEDEPGGEDQDSDDEDEDGGSELRQEQVAGDSGEGEGDEESTEEVEAETEMSDGEPGDEGEEGMMPVRPNRPWTDLPETLRLQGLHRGVRRGRRGDRAVRLRGARPPARLSRQPADRACRAWSPGSPTGCSGG
jgi:cobaltochelatase CobT